MWFKFSPETHLRRPAELKKELFVDVCLKHESSNASCVSNVAGLPAYDSCEGCNRIAVVVAVFVRFSEIETIGVLYDYSKTNAHHGVTT